MTEIVRRVAAAGRATWRLVDVDSDPELVRRYGEQVPVLLINGRKAYKYRVGEEELRRRLGLEARRGARRAWRRLLGGKWSE